jgi:hypothetical protein
MNPEVFFPFEVGTITVTLTNSGTTSVGLSNPDILSDKVHIMNQDVWNTVSYIGPGSSITYSFSIKADPPDGTIYALSALGQRMEGVFIIPLLSKWIRLTSKPTCRKHRMHLPDQHGSQFK